ncbi:MAG: Na+/H+ antiporter NhaA [Acidimicrobiia bacterium]
MPNQELHRTWLHSERFIPRRFIRPALRFTQVEAASGIVLLVAAVIAIIWANSSFGDSYQELWETSFKIELGSFHLEETLRGLVNDGLMAVFFLVVGLEIKRELVVGELRDPKAAALPAIAALGGMVVPALIFLAFVAGQGGEAARGWGIPMATDIAFSIGVVALLGSRVPVGAKLFLLALAIVDDIGAIAVIAVFYTEDLLFSWLAAALITLILIWAAQKGGIRAWAFYWPMGILAWFFLLESGVHATLAGVALGLMTPARPMYSDEEYHRKATYVLSTYTAQPESPHGQDRIDHEARQLASIANESIAPLNRLEHLLHPWSSFLIVPLFALANAGVKFGDIELLDAITSPVALGVALGLLVGKIVGISAFTALAVRLGLGRLPRHTTWRHIFGLAALAGIGFTVSLFVTGLAFMDPALTNLAKIGIFAGSGLAGIIGYLILRFTGRSSTASLP